MTSITTLNTFLSEEAEKWKDQAPRAFWSEYYRGLMDIDQKESFVISSAGGWDKNPLNDWLRENADKYEVQGFTGCAIYTKNPLT